MYNPYHFRYTESVYHAKALFNEVGNAKALVPEITILYSILLVILVTLSKINCLMVVESLCSIFRFFLRIKTVKNLRFNVFIEN